MLGRPAWGEASSAGTSILDLPLPELPQRKSSLVPVRTARADGGPGAGQMGRW